MAALKQKADAVLDSYKGLRNSRACYPCAKRKIRCQGGKPCRVCADRGHADICFFPDSKATRRGEGEGRKQIARPAQSNASTGTQSSQLDNVSVSCRGTQHQYSPSQEHKDLAPLSQIEDGQVNYIRSSTDLEARTQYAASEDVTTMGEHSLAFLVQNRLGTQDAQLSQDVRPGLGLRNGSADPTIKPFSILNLSGHLEDVMQLRPTRAEILQFFPAFRSYVAPFYPIIQDIDSFELRILTDLDGSIPTRVQESGRTGNHAEAAELSLYLAALAVGVQFSFPPSNERATQSRDFAQRSMTCLHLSEFLFRPCLETIQTLLLVGLYLQNSGQADTAWSLLGLTSRLGQAIGLRGEAEGEEDPLWKAIVWQDSMLSLRFDRKPHSTGTAPGNLPRAYNTTYLDSMHRVCSITLEWLSLPKEERSSPISAFQRTESVDVVRRGASLHLQSEQHCSTFQHRLELYAWSMHSSFLLAEICRPFLRYNTLEVYTDARGQSQDIRAGLNDRCAKSLAKVVQAYVDMSRISIMSFRSWSLMHEALSCACVLAMLPVAFANSNTQPLLLKFRQVLESELDYPKSNSSRSRSWAFDRGLQLLKALQERFEKDESALRNATGDNRRQVMSEGMSHPHVAPDHDIDLESTMLDSSQLESGFDDSWINSLFGETGLQIPLSSFLDQSFDSLMDI